MKPDIYKFFYDCETTGTNHMKHSIHQLSGYIECNDEIVEEFNFKVRPHHKAKIEAKALEVCRVTEAEIMAYPEMKTVHAKIRAMLSKYVDKYNKLQKMFLVGFNNNGFDDKFFKMFFDLCGDEFFFSWFFSGSLDTMSLASEYLIHRRWKMHSFTLSNVAMELGIPVEESKLHDSLYDVWLTREVYRIVTNRQIEI